MRRVIALFMLICLLLTACGKSENPKKENVSSKKPSSSSTESDVANEDEELIEEEWEEEDEWDEEEEWDEFEDFEDDSPMLSGTVYSEETDFSDDFEPSLSGTVINNVSDTEEYEKPESVFVDLQSGGYDEKAKDLRNTIINTKSSYDIKGTTYYISPKGDDFNSGTSPDDAWQTLDALMINSFLIQPGDAVLFERGGVYRANSSIIIATDDFILGAYGEGPKPCIYGSHMNYADEFIWESSSKKNIWKMEFPLRDAGIMVFNNGEFAGIKRAGLAAAIQNGDFYHNTDEKMLYVYCDKGNPGKVWENIEIGTDQFIVSVYGNRHDIKIDNICFKYTGAHAVDFFENNYNVSITNCEFGWIGGSIQSGVTRYGNAIQFWDSCWNVEVKNNWIYQVYDAGITFQYSIFTDVEGGKYHDIEFSNNLIEYCSYSIEIFTSQNHGYMKNIHLNNNIMRFAGYGFGSQRPNSLNVSHICVWSVNYGKSVDNFNINNNIFDCSTTQAVDWAAGEVPHVGVNVSGNTFYQKAFANNPVMNFGVEGYTYALNQSELEKAIATFDKSPKLVKWLE